MVRHGDSRGQLTVSCVFSRCSCKKVRKLPAGRVNGRSESRRDRGFCDIPLKFKTLHLRMLVRVASHEKVAVLESNVLYNPAVES
jgi:hypothetical protein